MTPRNDIYKEWVESHPRTVTSANARSRISPFGDAGKHLQKENRNKR